MHLKLCLECHHPLMYHSAAGCDEILEMGDDGYPEVCDCALAGPWGARIGGAVIGGDAEV